jgi:hypothetical protein
MGTLLPVLVVNDSVRGTKSAQGATDIRVSWTDAPGPFNVYRGLRTSPMSWTYHQTCFANMTSSPTPDPAVPAVQTAYLLPRHEKNLVRRSARSEIANAHRSRVEQQSCP